MKSYMEIVDCNPGTTEFGDGVMVLSVAYTKGLEFDAVLCMIRRRKISGR